MFGLFMSPKPIMSPPSRAAWIEMFECAIINFVSLSPPSRAAWIEMTVSAGVHQQHSRRRLHGRRGLKFSSCRQRPFLGGRRLHGRRGLKSPFRHEQDFSFTVAAFTGGVD